MKNQFIQSGMLTVLALLLVNGITGAASGAALYYEDHFDNVASGADPSPTVGTWVTGNANAGTGFVAAASGPNYLDSNLGTSEAGYVGDLAGAALAPGTPVHIEMQLYVTSGSYPVIGINATETGDGVNPTDDTSPAAIISLYGIPGTFNIAAEGWAGSQTAMPGGSWLPDTWQKWEIDYVVGADTFTLTVAGNAAVQDDLRLKDFAAGSLGSVFVKGYAGRTLVDDIIVDVPAVSVPGDFDGDGDVDGADFVIWQTNFPKAEGGTLDTGDADGDGDVDGADFVVWQTNFPFTPGGANSPVPEPGSMILISLGGIIALARSRLRN